MLNCSSTSYDHHWLWNREEAAHVDLVAVLLEESDQLSQHVSWRFRAEHKNALCQITHYFTPIPSHQTSFRKQEQQQC